MVLTELVVTPHVPGMGGWVTYGVQNREVQDGEWWKSKGNGAAGASLKQGPAWWGHGKAEDTWQSGLSAVWSRTQALKAAKARKGSSSL